ncbi:UNVERIFIED_CONTAM: hypothetical protein Sangu_2641100 [Sesamum angustifolium]|uniref:Uncharacterized protein n=1 Tax=Sesamum angustifolium TaxID=2727405 RepID=A0AAW2J2C7_9LAMI
MTIPTSHFSQLTTWPTNLLKLDGRPTSPANETQLQYLVQVSIGSSMPNLEVLDLGVGFVAAKLMRIPTPRVNLSIRGHFIVTLKFRSISELIQLPFDHPFQQEGMEITSLGISPIPSTES